MYYKKKYVMYINTVSEFLYSTFSRIEKQKNVLINFMQFDYFVRLRRNSHRTSAWWLRGAAVEQTWRA